MTERKRSRFSAENAKIVAAVLALPLLVATLDVTMNRSAAEVQEPAEPIVLPPPARPGGLPHYMQDPGAASDLVNELARRTRGDYELLSDLEQKWINGMTAGYGHELLRMRAQMQGIEPEGAPPRVRGNPEQNE
jgi:hypothetical protein